MSATGQYTTDSGLGWTTNAQTIKGDLGTLGNAFNLYGGLSQGGTTGDIRAGIAAGRLASQAGVFGDNSSTVGAGLTGIGEAAGIVQGLQRGGVAGYGSAAINAARLGATTGAFGDSSAAIGDVAGYAAIPLALYNFASNWRSGATGSDALSGAESGAAIGSVVGPIGTVVGAVIGGVVGAASSLFGPGREDPENVGWNDYASAFGKGGAAAVHGATPSQNYQMLAGIFDSRGSQIPFYNQFGRMGEGAFLSSMTQQINSALSAGKINPGDSPQTIYARVVGPWVNSMAGPGGWQNTYTIEGAPEKTAVQNLLQNIIGQYTTGQITASTPLGIAGQTDPTIAAFGGLGVGASKPPQPGAVAGANPSGMSNIVPNSTNAQLLAAVQQQFQHGVH